MRRGVLENKSYDQVRAKRLLEPSTQENLSVAEGPEANPTCQTWHNRVKSLQERSVSESCGKKREESKTLRRKSSSRQGEVGSLSQHKVSGVWQERVEREREREEGEEGKGKRVKKGEGSGGEREAKTAKGSEYTCRRKNSAAYKPPENKTNEAQICRKQHVLHKLDEHASLLSHEQVNHLDCLESQTHTLI